MDDLRNQLLDNQTEMSKMRQEIRDLSRSKQQLLINTNNSDIESNEHWNHCAIYLQHIMKIK